MFIIREYAACVLMAFMLAAMLLVACGIGYLLKATGLMFMRTLRAVPFRTATLKRVAMQFSNRNVICTGADPGAIADSRS